MKETIGNGRLRAIGSLPTDEQVVRLLQYHIKTSQLANKSIFLAGSGFIFRTRGIIIQI